MKYISMSIYPIILSTLSPLSANQIRPKLCIDCKFYTKNFFTFSEFGKCSLFPKEQDNSYFLVNGNISNNTEYHYCSTARNSDRMCGEEGKFYEKK
jgi:hypothetical protein